MGVYIEAEAPFSWVNQSYDLRLAPLIVEHTAELLERDRSYPSVIIWSLVNESSWGPDFDRSHEYVQSAHPTRPISAGESRDIEIATRHSPISLDRIHQIETLQTPVIWDESLCVYQGIGRDRPEIWRDPADRDYWIAPLIPIWKEVLAFRVVQGSMIWAWADDLFQVPLRGSEYGRGLTMTHTSDLQYGTARKGVVGDAPWMWWTDGVGRSRNSGIPRSCIRRSESLSSMCRSLTQDHRCGSACTTATSLRTYQN